VLAVDARSPCARRTGCGRAAAGCGLDVAVWTECWPQYTAILDAIGADAARSGVPVLFVRLPERDAAEAPRLARFFASRAAPFLDLGAQAPDGLHFVHDGHIDRDGHAYVAAAVTAWIAEAGIAVPSRGGAPR
jgi:hypothetical protein